MGMRSSGMRVGDAERDAAVDLLNRHFADGRLTQREREERTTLALTARTAGDLDALFADLPRLDPPGRRRHTRRRSPLGPVPQVLAGVLAVALAVFVAVHLVPVLLAVALVLFIGRRAFGWRRGWCHVPWQGRRW